MELLQVICFFAVCGFEWIGSWLIVVDMLESLVSLQNFVIDIRCRKAIWICWSLLAGPGGFSSGWHDGRRESPKVSRGHTVQSLGEGSSSRIPSLLWVSKCLWRNCGLRSLLNADFWRENCANWQSKSVDFLVGTDSLVAKNLESCCRFLRHVRPDLPKPLSSDMCQPQVVCF